MSKSSTIQKKHAQISDRIIKLIEEKPMMPGAFNTVFVKCGNTNCWCASDKGHPFNRITWTENGTSRTKSIPTEDIPWVKDVTRNFRNYRKTKRELKNLQTKLKLEIDNWEIQMVRKTRKTKAYLKNL